MAQPAKKPNSFIKGMQSDLDANVMSTDAYKELVNGRVFTREDNAFVIKNAQGNTVFTTLEFNAINYLIDNTTLAANSQIAATVDFNNNVVGFVSANLLGVRLTISGTGFTTEQFTFLESMTGSNGITYGANSLFRDLLWQCTVLAINSPTVSAALALSVSFTTTNQGINLKIIQKSSTTLSVGVEAYYLPSEDNPQYISLTNGNGLTQSSSTGIQHKIVGVGKFSDYAAVIAHGMSGADDVIFKVNINADGSLGTQEAMIQADLSLDDDTSLRVEVSEENEHFHRIYWTDGLNPLRTLNLKEDPGYYVNITADDLNVFKASNLIAPTVNNLLPGGIVKCGSHSYCYRLITTDGKSSIISQISNPIQVSRTTINEEYHKVAGGSLSTESANSVSLTINNIDESYNAIQIINIRYTSSEGGIEANIITESNIAGSTFQYTHNGNETTTSISIGELLRNRVSWEVCKDLAIKGNRLFASNLTNNAQTIDLDFRVKSYRYGSDGSSSPETYPNTFINPNLYADTLYKTTYYAYCNLGSGALPIPGAETPGFATATNGVRVTFDVKKFDLSQMEHFKNAELDGATTASAMAHKIHNTVPLYGYLDKTFEGGYNNYKNPLFAKDFTGYQRGEVYRFGILFYDVSGNPTFVSPIGDIRMPDNETLYGSSVGGSVLYQNSDGARTYKHCGTLPSKEDSWSWTSGSTTLTKSGGATARALGDLVSNGLAGETSIPKGVYITNIVDANNITISKQTTGASNSTGDVVFDRPLNDVSGFALFPKFEVKLSAATRSKISGYSIVRVARGENDKRILASGVISQIQIHSNNDSNGTMRHMNGPSSITPFTPLQTQESYSNTNFTYDTPEPYFGKLNYQKRNNDKLKVVARLDVGYSNYNDELPEFTNIQSDQSGFENLMQFATYYNAGQGQLVTDVQPYILSGRFNPKSSESNFERIQFSFLPLYSQYWASTNIFRGLSDSDKMFEIKHAETVSNGAMVSNLRMSDYDEHFQGQKNQDFKNKLRIAWKNDDDILRHASDTVTDEKWNSGNYSGSNGNPLYNNTLHGAPTMFVSLEAAGSGDAIFPEDYHCGTGDHQDNSFMLNYRGNGTAFVNQRLYGQKLYVQMVRDVSTSQYGGRSDASFENSQYINTGHVNFNPQATNVDSVFGGDTYINMYIKKKIGKSEIGGGAHPSMGIIFPVESSVNLDLRDGVYLGSTDDINYHVYDDELMNETYGCENTTKTYVQKPANFKDVNNYSNLIAASNLKLAGDPFDAYTTWDANEIHELETGKGAIYNLFNLRGDLFAIQQSGVSKLTINPRVVVDNTDAAAVMIATGTGQVIERSDYIDTTYGSQHYNNAIVTNTAAYWYDNNMSAFCKLVYGQGIVVQDLGITTQNTNILHSIKDAVIGDKPLDYSVGGVCLYHNKILDEVGLCITQASTGAPLHLVYSELSDIMVTKKSDVISLAFNLPGELLTVGRNSASTSISAQKIYRENTNIYKTFYDVSNTNSISITFVCNENVYTSKKFDKLVLYLSENQNSKKFTNFTFTDSVSNTPFTTTGTGDKMVHGKHIIPITSTDGTAKATGQHLTIKIDSTNAGKIELFGALIHNRTTT